MELGFIECINRKMDGLIKPKTHLIKIGNEYLGYQNNILVLLPLSSWIKIIVSQSKIATIFYELGQYDDWKFTPIDKYELPLYKIHTKLCSKM